MRRRVQNTRHTTPPAPRFAHHPSRLLAIGARRGLCGAARDTYTKLNVLVEFSTEAKSVGAFAAVTALWSTGCMEAWKRTEAALQLRWGMSAFGDNELELRPRWCERDVT